QAGKPVIAYFYAAWCGPCMMLKYHTFSDPKIIQALEPFVRLKADLSFTESEKSREIANLYQINSFPTVVFFDARGKETFRFSGFVNSEQLISILDQKGKAL
ncbi:MAG: thioredoxin fold domain-containing protein, partial [Candidatus Omnitrophica bacterium]|nr:thioredoxin fold domain-containing protein [Candidatus Omnitrophota bacterium]